MLQLITSLRSFLFLDGCHIHAVEYRVKALEEHHELVDFDGSALVNVEIDENVVEEGLVDGDDESTIIKVALDHDVHLLRINRATLVLIILVEVIAGQVLQAF